MSKINLETLKKLFSVKKGGAEFFRLVFKITVWLFVMGAIFYGLVWVPSRTLTIQQQILQINGINSDIQVKKVQNSCAVATQNSVMAAIAQAQKEKREVTDEQKNQFAIQTYNNCVVVEGMPFLQQQLPTKKPEAKKPAVKVEKEVENTNKEKINVE